MTRREFLAGSAAIAATVALTRCTPVARLPSPLKVEPVLIVGAGIAGLTAAYRLEQAGVPVRIIEAQNRVGGRMLSLRNHFSNGQVVELGGELIDTNHTSIRALATELEIALDDYSTDDKALSKDIWFFEGQRRTARQVVEAFRPIVAVIQRDLKTIGGDGTVTYRKPLGATALDRMSLAEWLDRAGAHDWFRDLLEVGYTTAYGLEVEDQSALNLLLWVDPNPNPFQIYGESDERFHTRGGNDLITQTLASRLKRQIELNSLLEAVTEQVDGSFVCSVRRGQTSHMIRTPHLVLTIPFTMLRTVRMDVELPPAKRRAIDQMGYGTNAKLMVGFAERLWRTQYRSNGSTLTDLPLQSTWETSRLQPGLAGILTNFTGGNRGLELGQGAPAEQAAQFCNQLDRLFPGVAALRSGMTEARFHWPSYPFTKGSYTCYRPGQWTMMHGAAGERVRRLHFAGEHCSLSAQSFMEGGCETGEAVAREILVDLGLARPAPSMLAQGITRSA